MLHTRMAGMIGFATGCGGFVVLPVALPANLAGALYLQTRLWSRRCAPART
jgi:hypothetical protein